MDEGRKRVLLIAASILAARKLAQYDSGKLVPATVAAISDAVRWAEEIMRRLMSADRIGSIGMARTLNVRRCLMSLAPSAKGEPMIAGTADPSGAARLEW